MHTQKPACEKQRPESFLYIYFGGEGSRITRYIPYLTLLLNFLGSSTRDYCYKQRMHRKGEAFAAGSAELDRSVPATWDGAALCLRCAKHDVFVRSSSRYAVHDKLSCTLCLA